MTGNSIRIFIPLILLLVSGTLVAVGMGALSIPPGDVVTYFLHGMGLSSTPIADTVAEGVLLQIRLPRVLLSLAVGAALAVSGTLMQALFRNPIVEPGLIGTSSGASFGAAAIFVWGKNLGFLGTGFLGALLLPATAFVTGFAATLFVYRLSCLGGKVTVATMLLSGIAVNALASAGTGFLAYIARDPQARSITFWSLGTLSGADWRAVAIVWSTTIAGIVLAHRYGKGLNALLLGDSEAGHLGFNIESLKTRVLLLNTMIVAVATSFVGVIAFVGLIVPHLLRLAGGSDNRYLIPGSALLGALVLLAADTIARLIIAPAELPLGIITAFVGAPLFLWMLQRNVQGKRPGGFYA
jgi:iron complex transport system permease protein